MLCRLAVSRTGRRGDFGPVSCPYHAFRLVPSTVPQHKKLRPCPGIGVGRDSSRSQSALTPCGLSAPGPICSPPRSESPRRPPPPRDSPVGGGAGTDGCGGHTPAVEARHTCETLGDTGQRRLVPTPGDVLEEYNAHNATPTTGNYGTIVTSQLYIHDTENNRHIKA